MKITVELTDEQTERLNEVAQRLEVPPEQLAKAAFLDLLANPDVEFQTAAEFVLRKNRELYERLS